MKWIRKISMIYFVISVLVLGACAVSFFMNRDTEGPVIKVPDGVLELDIAAPTEDILAGVTATDSKDGDVSDTLMVEYISNIIGDNQREAGIVAFDEDGHVSKAKRIVQYNYTGIEYSLSEPLRFPTGTNANKIKQGLSAKDCFDGDVTRWIMMSNVKDEILDTNVEGEYLVEFSVSNSAGDVEKFIGTVEIYNASQEVVAPKITLKRYMIYIDEGTDFDPLKYIDTVVIDRELFHMDVPEDAVQIRQHLTVVNDVNTSESGWYEVEYSVVDSVDNSKTVRMIVCVVEKGE